MLQIYSGVMEPLLNLYVLLRDAHDSTVAHHHNSDRAPNGLNSAMRFVIELLIAEQ